MDAGGAQPRDDGTTGNARAMPPQSVLITEEGPREGFQIAKGPIPTARKVEPYGETDNRRGARRLSGCAAQSASARYARHGVANAYAGLEMGITKFEAAVAGLGGCPFAAHKGAAGNVCTEDLVFLCEEMGIDTGVNLDALIACARLAEDIVGHPLPGSIKQGGNLARLREGGRA
jgi:hypothetical protein